MIASAREFITCVEYDITGYVGEDGEVFLPPSPILYFPHRVEAPGIGEVVELGGFSVRVASVETDAMEQDGQPILWHTVKAEKVAG